MPTNSYSWLSENITNGYVLLPNFHVTYEIILLVDRIFELYVMLRLIVVTFEILALVMILRSGFVQFWLSDIQTKTTQWMHGISMTVDNQQLAKFRNEISAHVQDLTEPQTEYLNKITSTKTKNTT